MLTLAAVMSVNAAQAMIRVGRVAQTFSVAAPIRVVD